MEYGPDMSGKERALDGRGGDATDAWARNRRGATRGTVEALRRRPPPHSVRHPAPEGVAVLAEGVRPGQHLPLLGAGAGAAEGLRTCLSN